MKPWAVRKLSCFEVVNGIYNILIEVFHVEMGNYLLQDDIMQVCQDSDLATLQNQTWCAGKPLLSIVYFNDFPATL